MLKDKCVVLGVSGSIAAYKAASLASMLVKAGADVQVVMTRNAANFIHPLTFESLTKHKCLIDTFDRGFEYAVGHIALAKRADCFMIAPATANVIAKVAHGLADDMLTTTFLACTCPKLLAPAMNTQMYENPITQENIAACRRFGMTVVEPAIGHLACGDTGRGKMPEPEALLPYIEYAAGYAKDMAGLRVLVTAGPTREPLDPVRFLTNHSTGKMGYAVAKVAAARGARVTLVSGPVALAPPPLVSLVAVEGAADMARAVKERSEEQDVIVMAAAVADFRPAEVCREKMKKGNEQALSLPLERTEDILAFLGQRKRPGQFLCGFSMETENLLANSRGKLARKNLDMVVANSLRQAGAGFGTDTNIVTLITRGGEEELPIMGKDAVAARLLDAALAFRAAGGAGEWGKV